MFDIIFMSYQEPDADKHWKVLVDRFPWARRVHGVKGLTNAHIECAKISRFSGTVASCWVAANAPACCDCYIVA